MANCWYCRLPHILRLLRYKVTEELLSSCVLLAYFLHDFDCNLYFNACYFVQTLCLHIGVCCVSLCSVAVTLLLLVVLGRTNIGVSFNHCGLFRVKLSAYAK